MEAKTIEELVTKVNHSLGENFCNDFRYKRKELAHLNRASSSKILFKFIDPERDWVINEGGGVEIQFHLYYRNDEIGYGLGFNAQYVPFANEKSPIDYIRPFVDAFIKLNDNNDQRIKRLEGKGFSLIGKTDYSCLKSIQINDYYLFGKTISVQNGIIPDDKYSEMIKTIKSDLYNLYIAIWEQKNKTYQMSEEMDKYLRIINSCKNVILNGAPGTGKTYLAKQIAQQMIFGKTKENMTDEEKKQFSEQCGFVQFHPSYDYTDFVEGLRPKRDDDGNVGFERKDGIFKGFCKKALQHSTNQRDLNVTEKHFDESWQKLLDHVRENIAKGKLTKIGIWEYGLSSTDSLKYTSLDTPSKYTFTITKKNVFDAYRGLKARPSGYFQKYIEDVVKYMIENFGLQPYKKTQDSMKDQGNCSYVFIIDEINRGEISKVFGELFFSIDPGYRGKKGKVNTQYQNLIEEDDEFYDGFFVPENVYIIGTMNDIDRSVESMDFAFRRRFAFMEIKAKDRVSMLDDLQWEEDAVERMKKLNTAIEKIEGLSSAYHIGPAYFLKLKNYEGDFDLLWEHHIEGLLFEYMRGMTDVNANMKALANAYGYSKANNYDQPSNN